MKALGSILMMVFLLFPVHLYSAPPGQPPPSTLGAMRISLLEGDVQIKTEDTGEWVPASINLPLRDGDRLWVPEGGRAELQVRDGTFLRLDEKTALDILTVERDSFQFYLAEGRAFANFRGVRGSLLQIDTSVSSVRAYENAVFRVDVPAEGHADISVYRGSVYAESQDGKTTVTEGNSLSLRRDAYAELFPLGPPDEWENWNRERDRKFAQRRPPSRYLPEELQAYSTDFDENGKWVHVQEYGYVWTPTVVVSAGWAPYRAGRWVWVGGDYVWISYEPWGWAPYHYGRWAFVGSIGWFWVPPLRGAVYWGPGFVGWVRTPTYVSWVPLAPREIYYGYGYYGPHSVNITNVNITNINVTKVVYKNIHVHNSVTVVHHDTFVTGRHQDVHVRENPFLRERIHIGRPDIRPERATMMPVVRDIPPRHRPPEPIREVRVKEIKERRPLVKEREVSVFKREGPQREMVLKTREGRPAERGVEKTREHWPREAEKRKDRTPEGAMEKLKKDRRPPEREHGKIGEPRTPGKEIGKPREAPPGIEVEKPKRERKSPEREPGKAGEPRAPDKEIGKSGEPRSIEKEPGKHRERSPEGAVEKPARERQTPEKGGGRSKGGRHADKEADKH